MAKVNQHNSDDDAPRKGARWRHQPPSRADLRRYPAVGATCVRVRALLRDYADRDLSRGEREQVDEHAHECRDCGVALSRVEAEAYRLSRALLAPIVAVPADFVTRVMARARAEDEESDSEESTEESTAESDVAEATVEIGDDLTVGPTAVSEDFTPRVMERVRREWKPSLRMRTSALARRHTWSLLTVVAAAAAVFLWLRLSAHADPALLQVLTADGATLQRGGPENRLASGEILMPGDVVQLGKAGRASLRVAESNGTDRAMLDLDGGTKLVVCATAGGMRSPLVQMAVGTVGVRVTGDAGLTLALSDVCRIDMEPGSFVLSAELAVRHDGRLASEPTVTAVRLVALQGRAYIARGRGPRVTVQPGFAALFDDWSAISFEPCLSDAELAATLLRRNVAIPKPSPVPIPEYPDWLGRVINGRNNAGIASASVTVRRPGKDPITVVTEDDGSFRLEGLGDVEGSLAFFEVSLPEGSPAVRFGNVANFSRPITLRDISKGPQRERRLDAIRLAPERLVMGTVFDAQRHPIKGARVTPVIVDGLTGSARRMSPLVADVETDDGGRFVVRRLPAELPHYLDVYLLVEHAQYGAVATLDLLSEVSLRDRAIEVAMARRERVSITDLPPGEVVEILASIRNLAPSAMLEVNPASVNDAGVVDLSVAAGASLWLRHGETLVALSARKDEPKAFVRAEGSVSPHVASLVDQRRTRRSGVVEQGGSRFDLLLAGGTEPRTVALMDREGRDLAGAQLFLASKRDGTMAYLGEMNAPTAVLPMPASSDYRVMAVTQDGSVGIVDATGLQESILRVSVMSPGAARLPDEVVTEMAPLFEQNGGFLVFELHMTEPVRDYVVYRHTGRDSGWELRGLIPGAYRLSSADGRTWQARVPAGGRGVFVAGETGQPGIR